MIASWRANPRYGWTIVAVLAVTETVSWGVLYYAFAVFLTPMQRDLGWVTVRAHQGLLGRLGLARWKGLSACGVVSN